MEGADGTVRSQSDGEGEVEREAWDTETTGRHLEPCLSVRILTKLSYYLRWFLDSCRSQEHSPSLTS